MALKKVLHGALFVIVLPAALAFWARGTQAVVRLPLVPWGWGLPLGAVGAFLALAGMAALWFHGGGLPMNAFPPPRYVARGVYAWLAHPIYVGFCGLVAGVAILARSASGLWLISPLVALAATALVLGYERDDLRSRFGDALPKPRLRLAGNDAAAPSAWERISCYLLVLGPWLALFHAPLSLIAGLYLILGGLGRFVEEAYRGEPQTPIFGRLRLYQWIAIGTVLAGIAITTLPSGPAPAPQFYWGLLIPAACFGLATAFAMGVDFPESNRRFARLT